MWEVARTCGLTAIRVGAALLLAVAGACTNRVGPAPPAPPTTGTTGGTQTDAGGGGAGPQRADCGVTTFTFESPPPPDALILLDKSSSMSAEWGSVTAALVGEVMRTQADIKWGLKYFSNDGACGASGPAEIPPALNNADAMARSIATATPGGNTPTRFALQAGADYLTSLVDISPRFIVLVTDGTANCCTMSGDLICPGTASPDGEGSLDDFGNALAAVGNVFNAGMGIAVFIMGVGTTDTAVRDLNLMAVAGGKAQPADAMGRQYIAADDPTALGAMLTAIRGWDISCTLQLAQVPPDPNNVVILADGKVIPRDPLNGWSYGPGMTAIVFDGSACQLIMSGQVHQVSVITACPSDPIYIP